MWKKCLGEKQLIYTKQFKKKESSEFFISNSARGKINNLNRPLERADSALII